MSNEASPRPWFVNGHSIEANDPDGLWLQNEKTGRGVVANLPSCPKSRMSKKNRETWDAIVEANAELIVAAVNERDDLVENLKTANENRERENAVWASLVKELKAERDRAVKYAEAAPHPGSASWKEMQAVYAERDRLRDIVRDALPFIEGAIDTVSTIIGDAEMSKAVGECGAPPKDVLEAFVADGRRVLREARAAIGEGETPKGKGVW